MHRRKFLAGAGTAAIAGVAGCGGLFDTRSARVPPVLENRPDAVYLPTHVEGMAMLGTEEAGGYRCALTYTFPHRFWLVTGTRRQKVSIRPEDSVHLMPVVWDTETGIVPPDINPGLRIAQAGTTVSAPSPWPMLSQPMGFHFGDNVALDGDGEYDVTVSVGSPSAGRTGGMDPNRAGAEFQFTFDFRQSRLDEISYTDIPADREGTTGAVEPMNMEMMPSTTVPTPDSLPGTLLGSGTSGDAVVAVTAVDGATRYRGTSDETYLVVSLRTPYNRYVVPMASVAATIERGDATVYEGPLSAAIDPEMGYHYGALVSDVESGDSVTVRFQAPSQTARHEGYETAFIDMAPVTVSA